MFSRELEASSAVIGVRTPSVPTLQKLLKNHKGMDSTAGEDMQFSYLIYEGEEIDYSISTVKQNNPDYAGYLDYLEENAGARKTAEYSLYLAMNNNGRRYTYLTVDVPKGEVQSVTVSLKDLRYYSYRGEYVPMSGNFIWNKGQKYTIVELPDSYEEYDFDSIGGKKARSQSYTFEYSNEKATDILSISKSKEINHKDLPLTGSTGERVIILAGIVSAVCLSRKKCIEGAPKST